MERNGVEFPSAEDVPDLIPDRGYTLFSSRGKFGK
jgi:hypothetical protein